jgi:hypothetical protein
MSYAASTNAFQNKWDDEFQGLAGFAWQKSPQYLFQTLD